LLHDFENLLDSDLCTITKYDKFDLPGGIDLLEDSDTPPNLPNNSHNLFTGNATVPDSATTILPELSLSDKLTNIQASIQQKKHIPTEPDTVMKDLQKPIEITNNPDIVANNQVDKTITMRPDSVEIAVSDSDDSDKEESESEQDPPQNAPNVEQDEPLSPELQVTDTTFSGNSANPAITTLRKIPPPSQMVLRPRKNQTVTFQD
jgi:hypothetical protein